MMQPGFIPWWTDDDETAADRAKEFCRSRELTPKDAKIRRRNGRVEVVIKRACLLNNGGNNG